MPVCPRAVHTPVEVLAMGRLPGILVASRAGLSTTGNISMSEAMSYFYINFQHHFPFERRKEVWNRIICLALRYGHAKFHDA